MNLKNKILLIFFLLLMFILFLNTSNVFASFDFKYNDTKYSVPDLPADLHDYFLICRLSTSNTKSFYFITSDYPILIRTTTSGGYCFVSCSENNENVEFIYTNNNFSDYSNWRSFSSSSILSFSSIYSPDTETTGIVYSNHDVYYGEKLVFQSPVTDIVVIPALETAEEIPQAMAQTLRIMIPVGLVVLGIGLIIYLIKRVISLSH